MKAKSTFLFILICTLVSACFGAVAMGPAVSTGTFMPSAALGAAETLAGLQSVMRADPGTLIMEKSNLILMAWPRGQCYAFAILGKDGSAGSSLTSLRVNTLSIATMVKSLEEGGWKFILPAALPSALANALGMLTVEMAMTSVRAMPTIFLVPLTVLDTEINPREIQ